MRIEQVKSFNTGFYGSRRTLVSGYKINEEELNREQTQAKRAKRFGISVPDYILSYDDELDKTRLDYDLKGDIADPKSNPVSKKHLKNLFKNFYLMDKTGIYHNNFNKTHIMFSENGGVEFDGFRHSLNFVKKPGGKLLRSPENFGVPDFAMPSNADAFEEQFLSGYLSEIKDKTQKRDFMNNYLRQKSQYHQKRAELLIERGFEPDDKAVVYENIQSEAFKNPSDSSINYLLKRISVIRQMAEADKSWNEGCGGFDKFVSSEEKSASILKYLDCIVPLYQMNEEAEYLALYGVSDEEKRYFKFEKELTELRLNNLYNDTKEKALLILNDEESEICPVLEDEMEEFKTLYSSIDIYGDEDKLIKNIKAAKNEYKRLI